VPAERVFDRINELGLVTPFAGLHATFLNLYKSSGKMINELLEKSASLPNSSRYRAFLDVFREIYNAYEGALGDEIDFNDMINKATEYIEEGRYRSPYTHILVDEFQDISYSRYRLLRALLDQNPSARLFCVGDDWQSIYRFNGGDVSIMTEFERYFDPCEVLPLDRTFRFDDRLCEFSTRFILKNPNQIRKHLTTNIKSKNPSVTLIWSEDIESTISGILSNIESAEDEPSEAMILGRYNHQRPSNLSSLNRRFTKLSLEYRTVHSAKGAEADYVIVVGLTSASPRNVYAFPSEFADDPILDLVLAKKEEVQNAEERRLFYVAVTRAKKQVYLIASGNHPSVFAMEVEKEGYDMIVDNPRAKRDVLCPDCGTGVIVNRRGDYGEFYSCSNYPYCAYRPPPCPKCNAGFLRSVGENYQCSDDSCSFIASKCPRCEDGYLIERMGYSRFLGCSNYPDCRYTKQLRTR